jgi:hypothetical protein
LPPTPTPTSAEETILPSTPAPSTEPAELSPITPEEYAVYDAVIESLFTPSGFEMIVMVDHTTPGISADSPSPEEINYLKKEFGGSLEGGTLTDFTAVNDRSYLIGNHFSLDVPVVTDSYEQIEAIFAVEDGWEVFYDQYPNSQGVMRLSRVGFNAGLDQALVYVGNQAYYLAGEGDYVLLSKAGGEWKIEKTVLAWIS